MTKSNAIKAARGCRNLAICGSIERRRASKRVAREADEMEDGGRRCRGEPGGGEQSRVRLLRLDHGSPRCFCVGPLQALGYAYMPQYEARLPGELFFRKGLSGPWTHHLHILQGDHPRWRRRLLFRDYLRNHPEVARAYAKLKRDLAAAFDDDISGYMNAKTAFVAATLAEALGPGAQVLLDRPLPAETSRS